MIGFKYIKGQEKAKSELHQIVQSERIPNAVLITGPKGSGKLALAIAFANSLQCTSTEQNKPCGECKSCLKTAKFNHPDIHFSFPVVSKSDKKRADTTSMDFLPQFKSFLTDQIFGSYEDWLKSIDSEDKVYNINKEECNQIIKWLSLQKYGGKFKIQIIWKAETLNKEGNRLLKIIEEPTEDTIFILIADNQKDLLNTILSRCRIIQTQPFKHDEICKFLEEKEIPVQEAKEIANIVDGNIQAAINKAQSIGIEYDDILLDMLRAAYFCKAERVLPWLSLINNLNKEQRKAFCTYSLHFFKEYIRMAYQQSTDQVKLSDKEKNTALRMIKIIDPDKAAIIASILDQNIYKMNRNANPKMLWMDTVLSIGNVINEQE